MYTNSSFFMSVRSCNAAPPFISTSPSCTVYSFIIERSIIFAGLPFATRLFSCRLFNATSKSHCAKMIAIKAQNIPSTARSPGRYVGASLALNKSGPMMLPAETPILYTTVKTVFLVVPAVFPTSQVTRRGFPPKRNASR